MPSKKSLSEFVEETSQSIANFDPENTTMIKELIRFAIDHYDLKSQVEGDTNVLFIASIVEENMLSKLVQVAKGDGEETSIESIYEGAIVRKH